MDSIFYSIDKKIFFFLNGYHNYFLDVLMECLSNMLNWLPMYFVLFFILIKYLKKHNIQYLSINAVLIFTFVVIQIVICTHFLPQLFERIVQRISPCYNPEIAPFIHLVGDSCQAKYIFFTPKACTAFATSTFVFFVFYQETKWLKHLLLVWVLLVSYSRVYVGAHYPINVIIGDLVGAIIGLLTFQIYYYLKNSILVI